MKVHSMVNFFTIVKWLALSTIWYTRESSQYSADSVFILTHVLNVHKLVQNRFPANNSEKIILQKTSFPQFSALPQYQRKRAGERMAYCRLASRVRRFLWNPNLQVFFGKPLPSLRFVYYLTMFLTFKSLFFNISKSKIPFRDLTYFFLQKGWVEYLNFTLILDVSKQPW
jgi:hypothetical protein